MTSSGIFPSTSLAMLSMSSRPYFSLALINWLKSRLFQLVKPCGWNRQILLRHCSLISTLSETETVLVWVASLSPLSLRERGAQPRLSLLVPLSGAVLNLECQDFVEPYKIQKRHFKPHLHKQIFSTQLISKIDFSELLRALIKTFLIVNVHKQPWIQVTFSNHLSQRFSTSLVFTPPHSPISMAQVPLHLH